MWKKYINDNQILIPKMIEIYKAIDFDWMHLAITKSNPLTIHHIHEAVYGGNTTIDNAVLL